MLLYFLTASQRLFQCRTIQRHSLQSAYKKIVFFFSSSAIEKESRKFFRKNPFGGFMFNFSKLLALGAAMLFGAPLGAQAASYDLEWELVNPAGVIKLAQIEPAARISSLDGKTVALRWNGKNNGNVVLDCVYTS